MKSVKDALNHLHDGLFELETAIRESGHEPHLPDMLSSARGRLQMAMQHPHAERDLPELRKEDKADDELGGEGQPAIASERNHEPMPAQGAPAGHTPFPGSQG